MPLKIQRVPRGLIELLNMSGGETPRELEDRVRATLDLLQVYGLMQRRIFSANNAAAAEGTAVQVIPSSTQWTILFDLGCTIIKTATVTALRAAVEISLNNDVNQVIGLESAELGPFGATETGAAGFAHNCPYPRILPPNTAFQARPNIIGTDATCNISVFAHVGVL